MSMSLLRDPLQLSLLPSSTYPVMFNPIQRSLTLERSRDYSATVFYAILLPLIYLLIPLYLT